MRRITYWALSTISAVALLFSYSTSTSGPQSAGAGAALRSGTAYSASLTTPTPTASTSGSDQTAAGSGGGTKKSAATTKSTPATKAPSVTRKVTGSVASTQWGPVEVQLTITSGSITNVSVLQYPSGNGRDDQINSYALPILTQETLRAQSASIDMVSGATVTSGGYLESLQSALDKAKL